MFHEAKNSQLSETKRTCCCGICTYTVLIPLETPTSGASGDDNRNVASTGNDSVLEGQYWTCLQCTQMNSLHEQKCRACETERFITARPIPNDNGIGSNV